MNNSIIISRNFVELGPFEPKEIIDFHKRGILGELDHLTEQGKEDWLLVAEWIEQNTKPAKPARPAIKKAAPVAKKAPAKKSA
jgi:hypothetical protein